MNPKPITLTQVGAEEYAGPAPQPFAVVGGIPGTDGPTAIADVTGLQAIIDDLTGRIEALETPAG